MRKIVVTLGATALAATLAACSSSAKHEGAPPPSGNAQAPGTTTPITGGGPIEAAQFVAQATRATEKAQTVKLKESISLLGAKIAVNGAMRFGDKTIDASVTATTPGGPVQVVVSGGDVYLKGLGLGEPGKPWTKNAGAAQQISGALQQADPRKTLQMLSGVGTLRPVGKETVNGVPATHYSVTIDLAKAAKQHPQLAEILGALIKQGVKVEAEQLWVDSQQRPVRVTTTVRAPDPMGKTNKLITSTQEADFLDWGKPVTIAVPPASQVSDR